MDQAQVVSEITAFVTQWGLKVVGAVAVLVIGRIVAGMLRGAVKRGMQRAGIDQTLVPFLSGLVYYAALAVVVIAVLNLFGVETTSLVAILGAAGLAIGLALQGTLSNFASGVMLLVFRPFKVDDVVEIAGTVGKVVKVEVFNSILKTGDNIRVVIPNSQIYGAVIKNYNGYDTRRVDMVMGVSYDDDLQVAADTRTSILQADPRVLKDPAPVVKLHELGESSVNFVCRPWAKTEDYWKVYWEVTDSVKKAFDQQGISIPFPQRDIHVYQETPGNDA